MEILSIVSMGVNDNRIGHDSLHDSSFIEFDALDIRDKLEVLDFLWIYAPAIFSTE